MKLPKAAIRPLAYAVAFAIAWALIVAVLCLVVSFVRMEWIAPWEGREGRGIMLAAVIATYALLREEK